MAAADAGWGITKGPGPQDVWASGVAYEPHVGRWSRLVARDVLAWLDVPPGMRAPCGGRYHEGHDSDTEDGGGMKGRSGG